MNSRMLIPDPSFVDGFTAHIEGLYHIYSLSAADVARGILWSLGQKNSYAEEYIID